MECEICEQWCHIKCQSISKFKCKYIRGGTKKSTTKIALVLVCDRVAVNFMNTMIGMYIMQEIMCYPVKTISFIQPIYCFDLSKFEITNF